MSHKNVGDLLDKRGVGPDSIGGQGNSQKKKYGTYLTTGYLVRTVLSDSPNRAGEISMTVSIFEVPEILADEVSIMRGNDYYWVYPKEYPFTRVRRGWCVWTVEFDNIEAAADWYYMVAMRWDQMNDDTHTAHDVWKRRVTSKERRAKYATTINDALKTVHQLLVQYGATEYMLSGEALEDKRIAEWQRRYPPTK